MSKLYKWVPALLVMGGMQSAMAAVELSGVLQAQAVTVDSDFIADGNYLSDGGRIGAADGNGGNSGTLSVSAIHELGAGMLALARYSIDIQSDTGADNGPRESYVGLDGSFGTLLLGTIATPFKSATAEWDPFYGTFMQARGNGGTAAAYDDGDPTTDPVAGDEVAGDEGYMSSSLLYRFNMPLTTVALMYAADESSDEATDAATNGNDALSASVNINFDKVELALAYLAIDDYGQDTSPVDYKPLKRSNSKVGVRYHSDGFNIGLQWLHSDEKFEDGDYTLLNMAYRSGNTSYAANYGLFGDANSDQSSTTSDQKYMALGVRHDFSKQVSAFAGYRTTEIKTTDAAGSSSSEEEKVYGLGLRVGF